MDDPVAQNPDDPWGLDKDPYTKFSAYHGYWPINPTVLNPHFGTEEQLKEMLEEAHKRNINVIVDYVANHLHQKQSYFEGTSGLGYSDVY